MKGIKVWRPFDDKEDSYNGTQVRLRCTEESSPDACDTFEIFAERRGEGTYRL